MKNDNRKALAEMYIDLVPTVVYYMLDLSAYRKFRDRADEFLSEGYVMLCKAADNYDPRKGVKFKSYASLRLRGMVKDMAKKMYDEDLKHVNINSIQEVELSDRLEALQPERCITTIIEDLEPKKSKMYYEIYYRIILGDEPYSAVAKDFNTNKSNIKLARRRLLKKLRKQIDKEDYEWHKEK